MKKTLFFSIFLSLKAFSQSIVLTPDAISKKNSNVDDITMQSYATYPSIIGLRANGTELYRLELLPMT